MLDGEPSHVEVRLAGPDDAGHAGAAASLIRDAAGDADIAVREESFLRAKIESGRAVLALDGDVLVGFGYFSEWEGGRFVSHSGLVVRADQRGKGLGRRLKVALLEASRRRFPRATTMSLTSSEAVERMNLSLGFHRVPLSALTQDEEFWKGCLTCRNHARARAEGKRCCCFGMILPPEDATKPQRGPSP